MSELLAREAIVRRAFHRQAAACLSLGSPFTARLCTLVAARLQDTHPVGRAILSWPGEPSPDGDSVPLRFAGTLHALVLANDALELAAVYPPHADVSDDDRWAAVDFACRHKVDFILDRLTSAPQTNEVRRSAALLPGFLTIASLLRKPMVLSEVGASAGLNLQWDKYDYRLGKAAWGTQTSQVVIAPEWKGGLPPQVQVDVESRAGCDLNPLNPADSKDILRLMSYIWPDQPERLQRTAAALAVAAESRQTVEKADAVDWLDRRLTTTYPGSVHVIYHTIAWQYLPMALQTKGEALIAVAGDRATVDAPLARLQMEADGQEKGAALTLQIWPSGERHLIGRADFHGRWVDWIGWRGATGA